MKSLKLVIGLVAALSLPSRGQAADASAAAGSTTNVTVEVLIFSGRPNPTWQLQNPERLNMLKPRLKDAPELPQEEPAGWSRLGFAGFRIHGGEALGLPGELRVYRGVIKTGYGKAARYIKDSVGLEQSLINESKRVSLEPPAKNEVAEHERKMKEKQ